MDDAADGPSRKIKVLRRKHNTSKYSKYWVGDSSVLEKKSAKIIKNWVSDRTILEKICKNDRKWSGGWFWHACRFFQHTLRKFIPDPVEWHYMTYLTFLSSFNIKSKNYDTSTCVQVGNNIITDSLKICNSFNEYFTSIADVILKNRKYEGNKIFYEYLKTPLSNSFVFEPCQPKEEKTLIAKLNISKATGPNGVPTEVCEPLSKIYNLDVMSET